MAQVNIDELELTEEVNVDSDSLILQTGVGTKRVLVKNLTGVKPENESIVRYDPNTDYVQLKNGEDWVNWKKAHINNTNDIYGVAVEISKSNPVSRVYYTGSADGMSPAHMDFSTGLFNPGDWEWLISKFRPCMLKYDGTVDYYLDPNDYSKKLDGTASDIANTSYQGNAMIEIPKIWIKQFSDNYFHNIQISLSQFDGANCFSHHDTNGNEIDYIYISAYEGSIYENILRSLSGRTPSSAEGTAEITYAQANNVDGKLEWYIHAHSERNLINCLLVLLGKSTHTTDVFGRGHDSNGSSADSLLSTGTMNNKGLFWGDQTGANGVKVFGIENYYGDRWDRCAGLMASGTSCYAKMTWGTEDGTSVVGYPKTSVSGMKSIGTLEGTSGGYISKVSNSDMGYIGLNASGSSETYEADGLWFTSSETSYALVGGTCIVGSWVGAFALNLGSIVSFSYWDIGASLSCKPLATSV